MIYDPAPIIPALRANKRYEWLPRDDPDRVRLIEGILQPARLELVWCPIRRRKCVIELYEPWELRHPDWRRPVTIEIPTSYGTHKITLSQKLNPWQYEDFRLGRPVCIGERWVLAGPQGWVEPKDEDQFPGAALRPQPLDNRLLVVIRRGDGAARNYFDWKEHEATQQFRVELEHEVVDKKEAQLEAEAEEVGGYMFGRELAKVLTPKEPVLVDLT